MNKKSTSFWDKTHLWFLILVGVLLTATILWGGEEIDIQYNDIHFVTSYGYVNGVFIVYFLISTLIYYNYYKKGCYLKFGLNANHFFFSGILLMKLGILLQTCKRITIYQQNIVNLPDDMRLVIYHWQDELMHDLAYVAGWFLLGLAVFVLNIVRYGDKGTIQKKKDAFSDELIGLWQNWAGDDAGMAMMWWYGLEFQENDKGISHHYNKDIPKNEQEVPFIWKRLDQHTIRIKLQEELDSEWEEITYEISDHIGGYGIPFFKLTEVNNQEFWICSEPIYKQIKK
jgi:hypothetical protein